MKKYDFIIVGQGLAGTILAYTLLKKGKTVLVIDDSSLSSCSRVAAGNMNPIVFKRLAKSWLADEVLPFAEKFYSESQKKLNTNFFLKKEIMKLFSSEHEKEFWLKKAKDDSKYISDETIAYFHNDVLDNSAGGALVKQAGNLYVAKFLEDFRKYFMGKEILLEEKFENAALRQEEKAIMYKGNSADKIIFCEGWLATQNPFFADLPFRPAKGELLTVRIKNINTDKIIHKGLYLLPIGDDLFIAGSTYNWNDLSDTPTEQYKNEIIERLEKLLLVPYEIVNHEAGVRPAMHDRRPVIGFLPKNKNIGIFNGMGTKGVMLSPFFAEAFAQNILDGKALDDEVDVRRFF